MLLLPATEAHQRIERFQQRLQREGIDAALIVQAADLYYFAGTTQQATLVVPATGTPLLLARKSYTRAAAESPIETVPVRSSRDLPGAVAERCGRAPVRLGLELDVLPANLYFGYQAAFPGVDLVDISTAIRTIRMVKSAWEIDRILASGRQMGVALDEVVGLIREGMTEVELAGRIEAVLRRERHQGVVRARAFNQFPHYGHLMAGPSAAEPSYIFSPTGGEGLSPAMPQSASARPIGPGEPIFFDYVGALDGYVADMTRILVIGELPSHLARAHAAMVALQDEVVKLAKPGLRAGDLYEHARARATEWGYAERFMGHGESQVAFLGHGIGIELDEWPVLARGADTPLEVGMVLAIEPKLTFPGEGVVGVENNWVVRPDGLERLTPGHDDVVVTPERRAVQSRS